MGRGCDTLALSLLAALLIAFPFTRSLYYGQTHLNEHGGKFSAGTYLVYELSVDVRKKIGVSIFEETCNMERRNQTLIAFFDRPRRHSLCLLITNVTESLASGVDRTYRSLIGADRLLLVINVLNSTQEHYIVNYTVLFYNFTAITPPANRILFESLLGLNMDVREEVREDRAIEWAAVSLPLHAMSKLLIVDRRTNEVLDYVTGERLGEWIHWLHEEDLKSDATLIMVDHMSTTVLDVWRSLSLLEENLLFSTMVYVNSSYRPNFDFEIGNIRVGRERLIVGIAHHGLARLRDRSEYKAGLPSRLAFHDFLGYRVVDYGNGTADLVSSIPSVYERVRAHKPWRLVERELGDLSRYPFTVAIVEYDGYLHAIAPDSILMLVFEADTGVLLMISEINEVVARTPFLNYFSKNILRIRTMFIVRSLQLRLIDTNLPIRPSELVYVEDTDRVEKKLLLLVLFSLAIAALPFSLTRGRERSSKSNDTVKAANSSKSGALKDI